MIGDTAIRRLGTNDKISCNFTDTPKQLEQGVTYVVRVTPRLGGPRKNQLISNLLH